ncbi:MAG TPA: holin [Firmicutes bacterium]|nr:holin [Bacillota bacterium]
MQKIIAYLQPRMKNYGFWVSLLALVPIVLNAFGIAAIPDFNNIVQTVLSLLVVLGLLNNPTTENGGYADDEVLKKIEEIVEDVVDVKEAIDSSK